MRGIFCGDGAIRVRSDLPEPTPSPGEVLLKPQWAGICDTDLHLSRGYMGFSGILGHEFVALNEQGHRVTAEINNWCGACSVCEAGRRHHCPHRTVLGIFRHDGAMADWVCAPSRNLHMIPDEISDEEAVFIEPLAAAFRIPEQIRFADYDRVAILGDGKLGLLCAWVAALHHERVALIGKHQEKLVLAGPQIETFLMDQAPKGFDLVVDCTGSESGLGSALALVRPCGTIVLKTTIVDEHRLSLAPVVIDEVQIVGSRCGPFPKAIAALEKKQVDVRPLIESVYSLDDGEQAFQAAMKKGARKVLLKIA